MKLNQLLKVIGIESSLDDEVLGIEENSAKIKQGYIFVAIKGSRYDGNKYISEAFNNGAVAVLSSEVEGDKVFKINHFDDNKAKLYYQFYDNPQNKLTLIGVTGTNGKTSIAYIIYQTLNYLNINSTYLGTLGVIDKDYYYPIDNTTPSSLVIAKEMAKAVARECSYFIMEVSSHALDQNRVSNLVFDGAIYTNLSHEHLDYHNTMANYLEAKKKLFKMIKNDGFAILNYDDIYYDDIAQISNGEIISYGFNSPHFEIKNIHNYIEGLEFDLGESHLKSKLMGLFNCYNLSAAFICLLKLGFNESDVLKNIEKISKIDGRLEKIYDKEYSIIVDFAHTPDAMEKVLFEVRPLVKNKLHVLFGCGGNRDKAKRPMMGSIAQKYGDYVYLTSDNPRDEEPKDIISEIINGCQISDSLIIEEDRKKALLTAMSNLNEGDLLIVLGKGHENYQIIKDQYLEFSDKRIIEEWLKI